MKLLTLSIRKFSMKCVMTSEVIEGHIRLSFCLKIHFFLNIFFCLKYNLIKTLYECLDIMKTRIFHKM